VFGARIGVVHGDINDRNTLRKPTANQGLSRLFLVDFVDVAPEYKNDAFALGELFLWFMERCEWSAEDRRRIEDGARILKENGGC
jgi:hypothetical protein